VRDRSVRHPVHPSLRSVTPEIPLLLRSEMPDGGVIFSDGVEADYLAFNAGSQATIGLAKQKTELVVT
jgi:hypothetical protein